jgi:hypothetical protein
MDEIAQAEFDPRRLPDDVDRRPIGYVEFDGRLADAEAPNDA